MNITRIKAEAELIRDKDYSIREVAKVMNLSKSTIHKDIHTYLQDVDLELYKEIQNIFLHHKEVWHLKGGEKTKQKYQKYKLK